MAVLLPGVLTGCGSGSASCPPSAPCHDASAIDGGGFGQGGGVGGVSSQTSDFGGVGGLAGGSGAIGGTANAGATSVGTGGVTGGSANGSMTAGGASGTSGTRPADAGAPTIANGSACAADSSCQSVHCTNGICCDSPCGDRFFSCNLDGHVGACTPMTSVYVDPLNGHDDATGNVNDPLKTLKVALSAAKSGWTIYLKPGTFGKSSGEDWSTKVPDGVAVQAVVEGNSVLSGGDSETGLEFAGAGKAIGIAFRHFATAVKASMGNVSIERCTVDGGGGVYLSGGVTATLDQLTLDNISAHAVNAYGNANVTVTGASIGGVGYVAGCHGMDAAFATGSATLHLSGVSIHDFGGDGVMAADRARVSVEGGSLVATGQSDCVGAQVSALGSSVVQLKGTAVARGNSVGAYVRGSASVSLDDVSIDQNPTAGVKGDGDGCSIRISGGSIQNSDRGIELQSICAAEVTGATLVGNHISISMYDSTSLKLRSTDIYNDESGILAFAQGLNIDLGTLDEPGNNSIVASDEALALLQSSTDVIVDAIGNTWNRNVQGADANGAYWDQLIDCPCSGVNFTGGNEKVHIQL